MGGCSNTISFKIWPLSYNEGVFFSSSAADRDRLAETGDICIEEVKISLSSWSLDIPESPSAKVLNAWIIVRGIPQNIWDCQLFHSIGEACCGLMAVSQETRSGEVISEIRIKASKSDWSLGLVRPVVSQQRLV